MYAGEYDLVCNWVANERTSRALEWMGQKEFVNEDMKDWMVDGKVAGKFRGRTGLLTFATVAGAGHMVCVVFV